MYFNQTKPARSKQIPHRNTPTLHTALINNGFQLLTFLVSKIPDIAVQKIIITK